MSRVLQFDEEAARRTEAIYTTPDVVAQRRQTLRTLDLRTGERVLDVGSGPGLLAFDMGTTVGASGAVCGVDNSEPMVSMAKARCARQPWVTFQIGDATRLPVSDEAYDVAVSTQVYEYVSDVARALAELRRVLRRGGRALIIDTDWDSIVWHSTDQGRMSRVLTAWREHLVDPHLPRTLSTKLRQAGFSVRRQQVIPLLNTECGADTYSGGLIGFIKGFVVGRNSVTQEEAEAWAEDLRLLGQGGEYFFSLNRYLFLAVTPVSQDVA
jgi:arsenite methyltransferase